MNNSGTAWPRITKIYTDIHADLVINRTGYDVTSYVWLAFIEVQSIRKYRFRWLWVEF